MNRRKLVKICLATITPLFCLLVFSTHALATQLMYQDFEQEYLFETPPIDPNNATWWKVIDPRTSKVYRVAIQGQDESWINAWFSPTMWHKGKRSFGVRLNDVVVGPDGPKHRVEFQISDADNTPQNIGDQRYYSFSLYVHPQSQPIEKETKFFQAWQNHDTSDAHYPPLDLSFIPSDDYRWVVHTAKCDSELPGCPGKGDREKIFESSVGLEKGVWYEFIVRFKPSVTENGAVGVWLDGALQVAQTSNRNFGYTPRSSSPKILDEFQVRIGAYRGRRSDNDPMGKTILMFDEVKIHTTYPPPPPGC